MTHRLRPTARRAAITLAAAFCFQVQANPVSTAVCSEQVPVDELKAHFLACDRLASRTVIDSGTAAQCSVTYECLKARAFGNDWEALLAWWRVAKP